MVRTDTALSMEQLHQIVPSAFAIQAHESRSERYAFIPTINVIQGMAEAGFLPVAATQGNTRVAGKENFTKHMIRFRSEKHATEVGDSQVEVVLVNSHDGTSSYKLMAGMFRLVCSNGMVVADSLLESINVRHTGNVIPEVIEGAQYIFENAPKVIDAADSWKKIELDPKEQTAFAEVVHSIRFPRDENGETSTLVTPAMLLNARRSDDEGNDLWRTFNRVQENATQGFRRWSLNQDTGRRERVTARAIKSIDGDVKINRALWSLAEKMAELKKS